MSEHPYEVLETVESESHRGTFYEIRKSHQDGKTYCTCPAWVFKARKGDGVCKHIAAYRSRHTEENVVVMTHADYQEFRRAMPKLAVRRMKSVEVKRSVGDAGGA